jgi:hypothetical protein
MLYVVIGLIKNVYHVLVITLQKMENVLKFKKNVNFGLKMENVKDVLMVILLIKRQNVLLNQDLDIKLCYLLFYSSYYYSIFIILF